MIFLEEISAPYYEREGKTTRAVMIGIDNYEDDSITTLRGAENDVRHLARKLNMFGGFKINESHMLINKQATSDKIRKALSDIFWKDHDPYDFVLLYYSGHGLEDGYGRAYLAPQDIDRDEPLVKGIRISELNEIISDYYASRGGNSSLILMLDCCHSGSAVDDKGQVKESLKNNITQLGSGQGRIIFASSDADEKSREVHDAKEEEFNDPHSHGIFTSWILKGIEGAAPSRENGMITFADLELFLVQNKSHMSPQKPLVLFQGPEPLSIPFVIAGKTHTTYFHKTQEDFLRYLGAPDGPVRISNLEYAVEIIRKFKPLTQKDRDFVTNSKTEITSRLQRDKQSLIGWIDDNMPYIMQRCEIVAKENRESIERMLMDVPTYSSYERFEKLNKSMQRVMRNIFFHFNYGISFAEYNQSKDICEQLDTFILRCNLSTELDKNLNEGAKRGNE